jgi:hypothetical protein
MKLNSQAALSHVGHGASSVFALYVQLSMSIMPETEIAIIFLWQFMGYNKGDMVDAVNVHVK